jgi:hypothetical protein
MRQRIATRRRVWAAVSLAMLLVAQSAAVSGQAQKPKKFLTGTARADYLKLDEMGMLGVTHMMRLDRRNLEIADIMLNWVGKNVRKNGKRSAATN